MKILQKAITNYFDGVKNDITPKCFNDMKEYSQWVTLEADSHTEPRQFPCRDCNVAYQDEMKSLGRCYIPSIPVAKIIK